jgi:hypothetical protein
MQRQFQNNLQSVITQKKTLLQLQAGPFLTYKLGGGREVS